MSSRGWSDLRENLEKMKESANEHFRSGDVSRASEIYRKVLEELLNLKDLKGSKTVEGDKLLLPVYLNLALCSQKGGDFRSCIDYCSHALSLDKNSTKALYRRGEAYESLRYYEAALKDFENLSILDPKSELFAKSAARCRDASNKNPEIIERSQVPKCSDHVSFAYKDKMVMWGGGAKESPVVRDILHIYWPLADLWFRYQTRGAPTIQVGYASVIFQNKLAIFGGGSDANTVSDDLYILDLDTLVWSKMKPSGSKRYCATGWCYNERLWFFGGDGAPPEATYIRCFNDILCYNLTNNTWSIPRCRGRIPEARYCHSTTDLGDGRILLFGGKGTNGLLNDVHILNMDTLTWTSIETESFQRPTERGFHVATLLSNGDRLLVHGGSIRTVDQNQVPRFSTADDSWVLDIKRRQWSKGFITPTPLSGHSAVNIDGDVFFYGGAKSDDGGRTFHYTSKMLRYKSQGGTPDRLQNLCLKSITKWPPGQKEMLMSKNLPKTQAFVIAKLICHPKNQKVDIDIANLQSPLALLNL